MHWFSSSSQVFMTEVDLGSQRYPLKGVEQNYIVMRIPDISYSGARTYTMNNVYKSKASALGISISAISHPWTPPASDRMYLGHCP